MAGNTASYSFLLPTVGGDTDVWGGFLNSNWEDIDDLLDGTAVVDGIDIDGGSIDGTPIGAATPSSGIFTDLGIGDSLVFTTETLTLVGGVATPSTGAPYYVINGEGAVADTLDTLGQGENADNGIVILRRGDANITITHEAGGAGQISLTGGEDVTLGSGDTIVLLRNGTIWRELARGQVPVLDEDDFASDSPTSPPSQQSAKAFGSSAYEALGVIRGITPNAGNANLLSTDGGKLVRQTSGSANTLTIQDDATGGYSGNFWTYIQQAGDGVTTIQADAGVTLNGDVAGSVDISGKFAILLLIRVNTDEWTVSVIDTYEEQLLHVRDEKASGTEGGTFTSGAWQTRTLNTVKTNEISGASLSSNQIVLPAGTYYIEAVAPAYNIVDFHKAKLRNVTDGTDTIIGTNSGNGTGDVLTESIVKGRFTIAASKTFELQHRSSNTQSTNGFGKAVSFGVVEVYAEVVIRKIS